jgi:hypothetical protein
MSEHQHLNSTVDRYISKKAKDVARGAFLAYWISHVTVPSFYSTIHTRNVDSFDSKSRLIITRFL